MGLDDSHHANEIIKKCPDNCKRRSNASFCELPSVVASTVEVPAEVVVSMASVVAVDTIVGIKRKVPKTII